MRYYSEMVGLKISAKSSVKWWIVGWISSTFYWHRMALNSVMKLDRDFNHGYIHAQKFISQLKCDPIASYINQLWLSRHSCSFLISPVVSLVLITSCMNADLWKKAWLVNNVFVIQDSLSFKKRFINAFDYWQEISVECFRNNYQYDRNRSIIKIYIKIDKKY